MYRTIQDEYNALKRDSLQRAKELKAHIDGVVRGINDDNYPLNDLGEFQSLCNILDCRIAALAVVRRLIQDDKPLSGGVRLG